MNLRFAQMPPEHGVLNRCLRRELDANRLQISMFTETFQREPKMLSCGNLIKTIPRENRACADKVVSFAKINYHFSKSQMLQ